MSESIIRRWFLLENVSALSFLPSIRPTDKQIGLVWFGAYWSGMDRAFFFDTGQSLSVSRSARHDLTWLDMIAQHGTARQGVHGISSTWRIRASVFFPSFLAGQDRDAGVRFERAFFFLRKASPRRDETRRDGNV